MKIYIHTDLTAQRFRIAFAAAELQIRIYPAGCTLKNTALHANEWTAFNRLMETVFVYQIERLFLFPLILKANIKEMKRNSVSNSS